MAATHLIGTTSEPTLSASREVEQVSLSREQILDAILSINHTAPVEFLSSFSDRALRLYMEHLQAAAVPRGRHARWVRPSESRAVCVHESID